MCWFKNYIESNKGQGTVTFSSPNNQPDNTRENISEYVAELQLHMTLQARNLLPNLTEPSNNREKLLYETQAHIEKLISRQMQ